MGLRDLWQAALDLVFPPCCLVCRDLQQPPLCARCREDIEFLRPPWCVRCGQPFDPLARHAPECAECRSQKRPPYSAARAVARFEGTVREAIHRLKYDGKQALAEPLGELMLTFLERTPEARAALGIESVQFIVPVPLHPRRQRQRGFNQSELLAQVLGRGLGIPVEAAALQRIRETVPQVHLSGKERVQNVRGAFAARPDLGRAGENALLVDDMHTTGATVRECAGALRRQRVARVSVLTLARTV